MQLVSESLVKSGYPGPLALSIAAQLLTASRNGGDPKASAEATKALLNFSVELKREHRKLAAAVANNPKLEDSAGSAILARVLQTPQDRSELPHEESVADADETLHVSQKDSYVPSREKSEEQPDARAE